VIVYDLRGHGQSDRGDIAERNMDLTRFAEDLYELIEGLRLDKVNLVGRSMGTSTLFAYVRKYGCRYVNKLCMIDMTPKLLIDDEWKLGVFGSFSHKDNLDIPDFAQGTITKPSRDSCKFEYNKNNPPVQ
jgi:pimeloyl-ACP methyl ester carboxylesterase